jgi:hypothetical protein
VEFFACRLAGGEVGALNLAAMRNTAGAVAVMSLVDSSDFDVYQGEFLRRACRSSPRAADGGVPAIAVDAPDGTWPGTGRSRWTPRCTETYSGS